jgi:hypothetical protein
MTRPIPATPPRSRAADRLRVIASNIPPKSEGAGNAGARHAPAASCAAKKAHEFVATGTPQHPAFPARWVRGLYAFSPVSGLVVTVVGAMREHRRQLDPSVGGSGPRDFAATLRVALVWRIPKRPPHPAPNVRDDRDTPLFDRARDVQGKTTDLPDAASEMPATD